MWSRDDLQTRIIPACIGMIHLDPLPGAPRHEGGLERVLTHALADLEALTAGGVRAVMVENFHDAPFHPGRVPPETVAAMAVVASEIRRAAPSVRLGVNVLRNDADAALGLAAAVGAGLIRVNVHTGSMVADQGTIEGQAHRTLRRRRELDLEQLGILADLRVKHAAPLAARDLVDEARDLRLRGLADALIVSGAATGLPADPRALQAVREALPDCPLLVGSGVTLDNAMELLTTADAVIVGTSLKGEQGRIDPERVRALVTVLARRKEGP